MFKSAAQILIKSLDDDGKNYFENFVTNFLGISDISIKNVLMLKKIRMKTKKEKTLLMLKFIIKAKKIDLKQ